MSQPGSTPIAKTMKVSNDESPATFRVRASKRIGNREAALKFRKRELKKRQYLLDRLLRSFDNALTELDEKHQPFKEQLVIIRNGRGALLAKIEERTHEGLSEFAIDAEVILRVQEAREAEIDEELEDLLKQMTDLRMMVSDETGRGREAIALEQAEIEAEEQDIEQQRQLASSGMEG